MWGWYPSESLETGLRNFEKAIKTRKNLKVFIVLDNPWSDDQAPLAENFNPIYHVNRLNPKDVQFEILLPRNKKWLEANEKVKTLTREWATATIIETSPNICPNDVCNLAEWYRDANHLQPKALEEKGVWLDPIFEE